jgi:hypothetical protein
VLVQRHPRQRIYRVRLMGVTLVKGDATLRLTHSAFDPKITLVMINRVFEADQLYVHIGGFPQKTLTALLVYTGSRTPTE